MFAACFLNDSTSRLFFPPLRRLSGIRIGSISVLEVASVGRGVGEAAVLGREERERRARDEASESVDKEECILKTFLYSCIQVKVRGSRARSTRLRIHFSPSASIW